MHKRFLYIILLLVWSVNVQSEVALVNSQRGVTGIAPAFFGPNAFPIPDMLDGRTQEKLRIEVAGDGYFGFQGDRTADLFARVFVPLWTPRVNLTVWMPIMEWYRTPKYQGHGAGDVYVSTDIHVLKARRFTPDIAFRVALKTASGGQFERARHFDSPGYWIDLSAGKSLYIHRDGVSGLPMSHAVELRLAGDIGFLCWQTDNGRQNDALYYGVQLLIASEYVSARASWSGYSGWEYYGDRPMTIQVKLSGHIQRFEPFVQYQYGIRDYPYHQVRVGLACHFDILKKKEVKP